MMRDKIDKMEYAIKAEVDSQLFALNGDNSEMFALFIMKKMSMRLKRYVEETQI